MPNMSAIIQDVRYAVRVSGRFFEALGFQAAIGRTSSISDELDDASGVVVLSNSLWRRRFAADRNIAGRKIVLSGLPLTVIGVMPAGVQHVGGDYRSLPH